MHNICFNPDVSLMCRAPLSLSFNDPSYLFDDTTERNLLFVSASSSPKCCCSCCCCYYATNISMCNRLAAINPSFLCKGLRQSTLIQWSLCKRLIFHSRSRRSYVNTSGVSSFTDLDRNYYYEKLCSFKERRKQGRWVKGGYECRGFEHKRKKQFLSNASDDYVDDVEVMLSLLTDEVGLEYIGIRDRKKINKKHTCCDGKEKKNEGSGVVKRDLKCDEVVKVRSTEEDDRRQRNERREEERQILTRSANLGLRKEGSTCSYHSLSSAGELESDKDFEVKSDGYVGQTSSSEYKNDWKRRDHKGCIDEVVGNVDRRQECVKEQGKILEKDTVKGYYGESVGASQYWRKKSEKKLNEEFSQHQSNVSVDIRKASRQQHIHEVDRITDESGSTMKYKRFKEMSDKGNNIIESTSSSHKRYNGTEKKLKVISEVSKTQEIGMRGTSSLSESRMKSWEENSTEASDRVKDSREEKHQKMDHLIRLTTGSREKSQQILGISDTHVTNSENTSFSHRKSDVRMEKQKRYPETSSSEAKVTKAQQVGQVKTSIEDNYSSSGMKLVEGTTDEGVSETELRKTGRRTTKASSFHVGMPKEASSTFKALKLNPEPAVQEGRAHGGGESSSRPTVTDLSPKQSRGQSHVELTHEILSHHFETVTGPQETSKADRSEIVGVNRSGGFPRKSWSFVSHEDTLASAGRQQKSSMHFVSEFDETARLEMSTSEVQLERKSHEAKLVYKEGEQDKQKTSDDGSGSSRQKDDGSRHSSWGSGPKGPADEMWHVTDASIQEPSETDALDNISYSSENGGAVKTSGRSLWTIIGDVVRLHWASPRSETHTPNSGGGKGSSYLSASSEAWFSGHEPDDSNDENVKKISTKGQSRSQREASVPSSSKDKVQNEGLDSPLPSSNNNEGPSRSTSLPIIEESSFPLLAIRMRRTPTIKKTSEAGETDKSASGKMAKTDQPVPNLLTEISQADASGSGKLVIVDQSVPFHMSGTDSKNEELKRRKLVHIDQVSKENFDEWEKAYTLEAKQRKNDEMFMREALLEAKKAADVWEVPVGAVLVQGGKIIARGHNLVEEFRDSTAHAEMMCIRQASTNLRSWRLSDTTLYVTLEPCPMCAGAILQARIDTVVWGAPNKLLGADGSWIRLFRDGNGGNGSMLTDKPPAPAHPFHPNMAVRRGVLAAECAEVMQNFFRLRRKKKTEPEPEPPTPPSSPLVSHHHHHPNFFSKMHHAFNIIFCL